MLREVGGDAALWFDPHDLESIAGAIRTVATKPEVLPGHGRGGLEQAAQFSWDRVAGETLEIFWTALRRTPLTRAAGPPGRGQRSVACSSSERTAVRWRCLSAVGSSVTACRR